MDDLYEAPYRSRAKRDVPIACDTQATLHVLDLTWFRRGVPGRQAGELADTDARLRADEQRLRYASHLRRC